MNKEEVLKKAQNKKRGKMDEMEMDILLRGNHVGLCVGLVLCLVIMAAKMFLNEPYQDIYAVFCSILCGQYLYKGFRLKSKSMTSVGLIWGFTSLILLVGYFI